MSKSPSEACGGFLTCLASRMAPAQVPRMAPPSSENFRTALNRPSSRRNWSCVVLSPPGRTMPSQPSRSATVRNSTVSAPRRCRAAAWASKSPWTARIPIFSVCGSIPFHLVQSGAEMPHPQQCSRAEYFLALLTSRAWRACPFLRVAVHQYQASLLPVREALHLTDDRAHVAHRFHHVPRAGFTLGADQRRAFRDAPCGFAQVARSANERHTVIMLPNMILLVGGRQHFALVNEIRLQRLEYFRLREMTDTHLGHHRYGDRLHDLANHLDRGHPRDAAFLADVRRNALQ